MCLPLHVQFARQKRTRRRPEASDVVRRGKTVCFQRAPAGEGRRRGRCGRRPFRRTCYLQGQIAPGISARRRVHWREKTPTALETASGPLMPGSAIPAGNCIPGSVPWSAHFCPNVVKMTHNKNADARRRRAGGAVARRRRRARTRNAREGCPSPDGRNAAGPFARYARERRIARPAEARREDRYAGNVHCSPNSAVNAIVGHRCPGGSLRRNLDTHERHVHLHETQTVMCPSVRSGRASGIRPGSVRDALSVVKPIVDAIEGDLWQNARFRC